MRGGSASLFRILASSILASWAGPGISPLLGAPPEVRGTWVTTTANDHIATPERTAATMRRLAEIGLNTVYVESWKNGYTQFPCRALERVIGVDRKPDLVGTGGAGGADRDLLGEMVIEAHRNGLMCIAWFEYGFMAAQKDTHNLLREKHPEWLSRDIDGNEVAPNGFVWMNPLHPETRRLLTDIVLEAVDRYDLDGVQLDDRIVWPYVTMGYDDFTVAWYRNDHAGAPPPEDPHDPEWMRWRVEKVNAFARQFVAEIRAKRPGLIVSLSPAPYPWCYENYLLEWPEWVGWRPGNTDAPGAWGNGSPRRNGPGVWWDEFIPQCYRYDYASFAATWDQQIENLRKAGPVARDRIDDMLAGILTTGSKPDPVPWDDLRRAVEHERATGGGGHVWWFSRGVLDEYPEQMRAFYDVAREGRAAHPGRPGDWRPVSIVLVRAEGAAGGGEGRQTWRAEGSVPVGDYSLIVKRGGVWGVEDHLSADRVRAARAGGLTVEVDARTGPDRAGEVEGVELLVDRRQEMRRWPPR